MHSARLAALITALSVFLLLTLLLVIPQPTGNAITSKERELQGTPAPEIISGDRVTRTYGATDVPSFNFNARRGPPCNDDDEGISPFLSGEVTEKTVSGFFYKMRNISVRVLKDRCLTETLLVEYYCKNERATGEFVSCKAGCSDGSCRVPEQEEAQEAPQEESSGPRIVGDSGCLSDTNAALQLLKEKAPIHYSVVNEYIKVIECSDKGSGMYVADNPPKALIGRPTMKAGVDWYASVLAHESCHSKQYRDYKAEHPSEIVPSEMYHGRAAETQCLNVQYDTLQKLEAPRYLTDYIKKVIDTEYWDVPYGERWW